MIDYQILADSIKYYEKYGFVRIEIPWMVTKEISAITKPTDRLDLEVSNGKVLVASGEQSFLYQYMKGYLPLGRFQGICPCHRFENQDFTHQKSFMKNELIDTKDTSKASLDKMVEIALKFYQIYIPDAEIVTTKDGYDIEWKGYELGSYGIRECEFIKWCFGTACAEGRLSSLIKLYKQNLYGRTL